jgi:hypothetical protein
VRYINLLILLAIKKNCQGGGRNLLSYLCKQVDESDCSNYPGISLISNTCTVLFNTFLSNVTRHLDKIFGVSQSGFQRNRSHGYNNQIFCLRHILENSDWNGTVSAASSRFRRRSLRRITGDDISELRCLRTQSYQKHKYFSGSLLQQCGPRSLF